MKTDIILEDATLRDGEFAAGIAFNKEAKIEIYKALVEAGVNWLEVGMPGMGGTELESTMIIKDMALSDGVVALSYNKGTLEDISISVSAGFKAVHFGLPTVRKDKKFTRKWIIDESEKLINFCKDKDIFVSVSAVDAGRSDISFLQDYACIIQEAGADRLRLSDTIGILNPQGYKDIIEAVKKVSTIDLQCHAHNDYGFALANTVAALEGGARYCNVTVNGLGERAGMPDLAQVALALTKFYNIDLGIKFDKLTKLANVVAKYTKVPLCPWQPIVGSNVFYHEEYKVFEPFPAELIGGEKRTMVGKHSNIDTIKRKLESLSVKVNEEFLEACLRRVREESMKKGSDILDKELKDIYDSCDHRLVA